MEDFASPVERKYEYISVDPETKQQLFAASIQQGEQECMQVNVAERAYPFAFLKEGAFAVRLESFLDQPIIAKVEVDGVLSRANHRILPLSVTIVRDIRVSAGQTAEPLFYACREEHNPRTVQLNSMTDVDSYTGLLRVLFFSVRITAKGAWTIDNLEPIGVILIKCGHHKPLRIFFGLTVEQVRSRPRQKFRSRSRSRSAQGNRTRDGPQVGSHTDPTTVHAKTARQPSHRRSSPGYARYASTGKVSSTAPEGGPSRPTKRSVTRTVNLEHPRETSPPPKGRIIRSNSRGKGGRVNSQRPSKAHQGSEENPQSREVERHADRNSRVRRPRIASNLGAQKQIDANPKDHRVENVAAPIVEGEWKTTPPPSPLAEGAVEGQPNRSAPDSTLPRRSASITRGNETHSHPIDVTNPLTGISSELRTSQRSSSGRRGSTPQDDGLVRYIEESFSRSGSRMPSPSVTSLAQDAHTSHNVRDSLNAFAPGSGGAGSGGGSGGGGYSVSGLGGVRGSVSEDPFAQPYRTFAVQALHPTLRHSVDTQGGYLSRTLSPQAVAPSAMRDSVTIERAGSGNDGRELVRYGSQQSTALNPGEHRRSGSRYTLCVKCEGVFGRERRMYEDLIEELRLQLMHARAEKEDLEIRLQEALAEAAGAGAPNNKPYSDHNNHSNNRRGGGGGGGDDADCGYGNSGHGGSNGGSGARSQYQPRRGSGGNGSYGNGAGAGGSGGPRGRTRKASRGGDSSDSAAEDAKEHIRGRKISFKDGAEAAATTEEKPSQRSGAAVRPVLDGGRGSAAAHKPSPSPPRQQQHHQQPKAREQEKRARKSSPNQGRGTVAPANEKNSMRASLDDGEPPQLTDSLGRHLNMSESISVSEGTCASLYDDEENMQLTGSLLTSGTIDDAPKNPQPKPDDGVAPEIRLERKLSASDGSINGNTVPKLPIQQAPTVFATRRTQKPTIDNRRTPKKEANTVAEMVDDAQEGFGLRTLKPSEQKQQQQQHTTVWHEEGEGGEGEGEEEHDHLATIDVHAALAHAAFQSSLETLQPGRETPHDETSWSPTPRSMDETIRPRRRTWSGGTMSDGREGSDRVPFTVDRLALDWDVKDDDVKSPKYIVLTGRPSRTGGRHHSVGGTAFARGGSYADRRSLSNSHANSVEFDALEATCAPNNDRKTVTSSQESRGSSSTGGQLTERVKEVIVVQDLKPEEDSYSPQLPTVATACFTGSATRKPADDHLRVSKCLEYTSDSESAESAALHGRDDTEDGDYENDYEEDDDYDEQDYHHHHHHQNSNSRQEGSDAVDADDEDERCSFQIFRGVDSARVTPTTSPSCTPTASFAAPNSLQSLAARDASMRTRATPLSSRDTQRKNSTPGPASGMYHCPPSRVQRQHSLKVGDPLTLFRPATGDETPVSNGGTSSGAMRKQGRYDRFYHPSAAPTPTMCATPETEGEGHVTPSDSYTAEFYEDYMVNRRARDADGGYASGATNANVHPSNSATSRNRNAVQQRSFNGSWPDDFDESQSYSGGIQPSAASPTSRQVYNDLLEDGDCSTDGVTPNSSYDDHPRRDPHRRHENIPPHGKRNALNQTRAGSGEDAGINSIDPNVSTGALSNGTNQSTSTTCTTSVSASSSSFGMMGSPADTKGVHAAGQNHHRENRTGSTKVPSSRVRVKHAPMFSEAKTEEEQQLEDDLAYQYYLESRNSSMLQDEADPLSAITGASLA